MDTYTIHGGCGSLVIDAKTGVVDRERSDYWDDGYKDIVSFDLTDTSPGARESLIEIGEADILDVTFITDTGERFDWQGWE